jgi:heme exporter protein D
MTLAEFIHMEGHGFYIWTSYGLGILIFALLYFSTRMRNRSIIKQLKRRYRMEQREQTNNETDKSS